MNPELFVLNENAKLSEALSLLEKNHQGFILTKDKDNKITGLATDGDIRRKLLSGVSLEDSIVQIVNKDFVWADEFCSRELLIKQIDNKIRAIPLLDKNYNLVDIVTRDNFPVQPELPVYSRARAPVRVSFGGGGSDLTHYFSNYVGAVINTTINLYSHATVHRREDQQIFIYSKDLDEKFQADDLECALINQTSSFGLILNVIKSINPNFGFDLYLNSDFPINSGLGGSAAISAAIIGCFNQFRRDKWNLYEISELAYQSERLYLGVSGGWQDQYATVFGGFNFIEFRRDQNLVHPLRITLEVLLELESSLILCDTGIKHNSGDIHDDQFKEMQQEFIRLKVKENVDLTYALRDHLLRGRLYEFAQTLNDAWNFKRQFSSKISNQEIDKIYNDAISNGAVGGKLLGAGGGGFFLFFVSPFRKLELISHLETKGLKVHSIQFDHDGLRSWIARSSCK